MTRILIPQDRYAVKKIDKFNVTKSMKLTKLVYIKPKLMCFAL